MGSVSIDPFYIFQLKGGIILAKIQDEVRICIDAIYVTYVQDNISKCSTKADEVLKSFNWLFSPFRSATYQPGSDQVLNSVRLELFSGQVDSLLVKVESVEVAVGSHCPDETVR